MPDSIQTTEFMRTLDIWPITAGVIYPTCYNVDGGNFGMVFEFGAFDGESFEIIGIRIFDES